MLSVSEINKVELNEFFRLRTESILTTDLTDFSDFRLRTEIIQPQI